MFATETELVDYLQNATSDREWIEAMEDYVDHLDGSVVDYLDTDVTSFCIKRGTTLIVTLETTHQVIADRSTAFPLGWQLAEHNDWSYLCLCSEQSEFFSTEAAIDFMAELTDSGFLAKYEKIILVASKYAAEAAYECARFCGDGTVIVSQPMTNPDGPKAKDFSDKLLPEYGNVKAIIAYDPVLKAPQPALPAELAQSAMELRCWHLGDETDRYLRQFGILPALLQRVTLGDQDVRWVYQALRKRRDERYYWRSVLRRIDITAQPKRAETLCRNVIPRTGGPIFKRRLREIERAKAQ